MDNFRILLCATISVMYIIFLILLEELHVLLNTETIIIVLLLGIGLLNAIFLIFPRTKKKILTDLDHFGEF